MKYAPLVLGGMLLAMAVLGLIIGKNIPFSLILFGLAALLTALGWKHARGDAREGDPLERWLKVNRTQVLEHGAIYQGHRIDRDTVLVRYLAVFSLILVTSRQLSRYYVLGKDRTGWLATGYFLGTAIAGWWGIPWGPIFTPIALVRNLMGGYRSTVGDILAHEPPAAAAPSA